MEHFEERTESSATSAGQKELLATKALWFSRHDFSRLQESREKVWKDPSGELQKLSMPLRELLEYVNDLEQLLAPARKTLFHLLQKKYLLELQLTPVTVFKSAGKTRRKKKKELNILTDEEIAFLQKTKPPTSSSPPAHWRTSKPPVAMTEKKSVEHPKKSYYKAFTDLSEDEALYLTYSGHEFRIREFFYTSAELGSSQKAPVQEDIAITRLERQTPSGSWREAEISDFPELERSEEFLSLFKNYMQLQKELQENI